MLRQSLLCHADASLMTYSWVKNYSRPYPNFNTWHQCENYAGIIDDVKEHKIPLPHTWTEYKLPDAFVFDKAPQPGDIPGPIGFR